MLIIWTLWYFVLLLFWLFCITLALGLEERRHQYTTYCTGVYFKLAKGMCHTLLYSWWFKKQLTHKPTYNLFRLKLYTALEFWIGQRSIVRALGDVRHPATEEFTKETVSCHVSSTEHSSLSSGEGGGEKSSTSKYRTEAKELEALLQTIFLRVCATGTVLLWRCESQRDLLLVFFASQWLLLAHFSKRKCGQSKTISK